jgi:hypothetical protein
VESPNGTFYQLDREEKTKVYSALETIFRSFPIYTQLPIHSQLKFKPKQPKFNASAGYIIQTANIYNCSDATLFNWLELSSLNHNCHTRSLPDLSASSVASKSSTQQDKDKATDAETRSINSTIKMLSAMIAAVILTGTSILALFALYYIFDQFLNSIERLWYNEGWLKAVLMFTNSLIFGSASTLLTLMFASSPLMALAVFVGINPVGVVIAATVCLTAIASGIGCFTMDFLYDFIDKKCSSASMDPSDPCRYRLTEADELELLEKHIDPVKVKCALVALRAEISKLQESNDAIPSFLTRHFTAAKKIQKLLHQVRELRRGNSTVVSVGNLCFDCRYPVITRFNNASQLYQPQYFLLCNPPSEINARPSGNQQGIPDFSTSM